MWRTVTTLWRFTNLIIILLLLLPAYGCFLGESGWLFLLDFHSPVRCSFLWTNQQCQSNEGNTEQWPKPVAWPHPLFIHPGTNSYRMAIVAYTQADLFKCYSDVGCTVLYLLVLEVSSLWNFLLHLRVSLTHAFDILLVELVCNEEFVCILVVLKFVCFTCLNSLYSYYQGCYY